MTFVISGTINAQKYPVAEFISDNQEKCSFYLIKDGELHGGFHEMRAFPMASLSKTLIAIEFAYQANEGTIDPEALVSISEMDRFVIDDDNYASWLKEMKDKKLIRPGSRIPLKLIAQGMIKYSANACADYIITLLGIDNVNQRIETLDMGHHQEIFPFTASLAVAFNADNTDKTNHINVMKSLTFDQYHTLVLQEHKKFVEDVNYAKTLATNFNKSKYKDEEYDDVWSGNFSTSTAVDYAELLGKINSGDYFPDGVQTYLRYLFEEWAMEAHPELADDYEAVAFKGAGTNSIVNAWVYTRDKSGKMAEFVALFNNLDEKQRDMLEENISDFAFKMCTDPDYLNKVMGHFDKYH